MKPELATLCISTPYALIECFEWQCRCVKKKEEKKGTRETMAGAGFPKDGIHGCVQNTAVGDSRKMGKGKKRSKEKDWKR